MDIRCYPDSGAVVRASVGGSPLQLEQSFQGGPILRRAEGIQVEIIEITEGDSFDEDSPLTWSLGGGSLWP